jgi:hypothetical protein
LATPVDLEPQFARRNESDLHARKEGRENHCD